MTWENTNEWKEVVLQVALSFTNIKIQKRGTIKNGFIPLLTWCTVWALTRFLNKGKKKSSMSSTYYPKSTGICSSTPATLVWICRLENGWITVFNLVTWVVKIGPKLIRHDVSSWPSLHFKLRRAAFRCGHCVHQQAAGRQWIHL